MPDEMNSDLSHLQSRMKALETRITIDKPESKPEQPDKISSLNQKRQNMKAKIQELNDSMSKLQSQKSFQNLEQQ